MGRTNGSTNKRTLKVPETVQLVTEQKVEFLANLIVDRIMEDQNKGQKLLKHIGGMNAARTIDSA